jgi:hypothetical protein
LLKLILFFSTKEQLFCSINLERMTRFECRRGYACLHSRRSKACRDPATSTLDPVYREATSAYQYFKCPFLKERCKYTLIQKRKASVCPYFFISALQVSDKQIKKNCTAADLKKTAPIHHLHNYYTGKNGK